MENEERRMRGIGEWWKKKKKYWEREKNDKRYGERGKKNERVGEWTVIDMVKEEKERYAKNL